MELAKSSYVNLNKPNPYTLLGLYKFTGAGGEYQCYLVTWGFYIRLHENTERSKSKSGHFEGGSLDDKNYIVKISKACKPKHSLTEFGISTSVILSLCERAHRPREARRPGESNKVNRERCSNIILWIYVSMIPLE